MTNRSAMRRRPEHLRLRLGVHVIQTGYGGPAMALQSAVSLLRTVFEDHYADPDYQPPLSLQGSTLVGTLDFTVLHRDGTVVLRDFTRPTRGTSSLSLTLGEYAFGVLRFSDQARAAAEEIVDGFPEWRRQYLASLRGQLEALSHLCRRFVLSGCADYETYCAEYQTIHGYLKRTLEIQVVILDSPVTPWRATMVEGRIRFGPLRLHQRLPMRLNGGDVVLATVKGFTTTGVTLQIEGVGSGGIRPGDRLYGLDLLYP